VELIGNEWVIGGIAIVLSIVGAVVALVTSSRWSSPGPSSCCWSAARS
jgi:hypothetical protein